MIAEIDPTVVHQEGPRPRTIAELTENVSASRLLTWQQCRLKFLFRYLSGIEKPATPSLHVGSTVHIVLQEWSLSRWRGKALTADALKQVFETAWASGQQRQSIDWRDEEEARKQAAWNALEVYFRETPIPARERPEGVEVGVEADLASHGLPKLVGVIDLVRAGGRIVDFKTAARTPDAHMLAHTCETQITAYGLLYREGTGKTESAIELHHLVKTKVPKLVVSKFAPISESQITRLLHVIEAYVAGLEREDFIPAPGLQCGSCEFFNECRAWH